MGWEFFIGISLLTYSVSVLFQRVLMKQEGNSPIAFAILFQFTVGAFFAIISIISGQTSLPGFSSLLPNIILMTVLYSLVSIFIFRALKYTEASKFTVIFASRGLITAFASSFFLSEILIGKQFLGAGLVFLGIILVNLKSTTRLSVGKGEVFTFLAALFFGFAVSNDRFLLKSIDLFPYMSMNMLFPSFFVAFSHPKEIKNIPHFFKKKNLADTIIYCALAGFSVLTLSNALKVGNNSSQIAVINLTSTIIIVFLSIIFLKERGNMLGKIVGALITFAGLVFLVR